MKNRDQLNVEGKPSGEVMSQSLRNSKFPVHYSAVPLEKNEHD